MSFLGLEPYTKEEIMKLPEAFLMKNCGFYEAYAKLLKSFSFYKETTEIIVVSYSACGGCARFCMEIILLLNVWFPSDEQNRRIQRQNANIFNAAYRTALIYSYG